MKTRSSNALLPSLILLFSISASGSDKAPDERPLLTTVRAVRSLSPDEAARPYPVRLRGTVTFCDNDWQALYVEDGSGGINVEMNKMNPQLRTGQMVEVEGISTQGSFLPVVSQATVRVLGPGKLAPAHAVPIEKVDPLRHDGTRMRFRVLVQNAFRELNYTVLDAHEGRTRIHLRVKGLSPAEAAALVDSKIEVEGVLDIITDSARHPIGLTLWVPGERYITVMEGARTSPWETPITPIAVLEESWKTAPPVHRIRIQGTMMPGHGENTLRIRDRTGVITAEPLFARPITPGDEVDLVGFADLGSPQPRIINATYLRIKAHAIQSSEEKGLPLVTEISRIRNMDPHEAGRGYPVKIRGVLTLHNPQLSMTFIQDKSDAIYVQSFDPLLHLEEGSEYEVEGFTAPGDFSPIIVKPRFRIVGKRPLPRAEPVTLEQLATGRYDCLRVQISGIVRAMQQVGNRWRLDLFDGRRAVQVWAPYMPESKPSLLQDSWIAVDGVCSIQTSSWGTISGFRVNAASHEALRVVKPAEFAPFSAPLRRIRDIFRSQDKTRTSHRVRIEGTLLHQQPGTALYVRDSSGSIAVPIDTIVPANHNDIIAVSGYPVAGEPSPSLQNVMVKRLSTGPPSTPYVLPDSEAFDGNLHGDLVRIRAKLLNQWQGIDADFFLLQDVRNPAVVFEAFFENRQGGSPSKQIRNGSELEVTGIYLLKTKAAGKSRFQLLLRTADDVQLIRSAPWWTREHLYWALAILFLLILSASAWAAMLKKRVTRQTVIIRQRLETEAALEKKYRDLFEGSNDIVFACGKEGKLVSVNTAGSRILGYSRERLQQLEPERLLAPSSIPRISEWVEKKRKGIEAPHLELELIAEDGRKILVEVNADLILSGETMIGAQGIARDITERRQAEEALRASEERLRHAQKLEALGRLAGGIAHDFNNILSAIMGYAELSMEQTPPDHPVNANSEQILKASKRARDLVKQILAFSRKLKSERRPVFLQEIVDEAARLLKATLPSTLEMSTDVDGSCSPVLADPTQMHQIVLNLVTNAAHALGDRPGKIEIALAQAAVSAGVSNPCPELKDGDYICLSVSDTGPGIEPHIQKHIFDPYFTTNSVGKGSGLGLAVVQGIVESHGGGIMVISTPGNGACFQVYLPCCENPGRELPAPRSEDAEMTETPKGRILLVDDEEALVRLGQRALERKGYEVVCDTSSIRALETFATHPLQFDVVVTDQTMPGMTGILLAQEIWKIRPGMPVILTTGYSEQITSEKASDLGFQTLLNKPYTVAELARAIRHCGPPCAAANQNTGYEPSTLQ